ncbi:hypothetical protein CKAN_00653100 [Cinnamomum micranthum f. kanehirae]|uniref:LRR receptor-like serine/threonine-protein kinase n=1 Tax=Cinnamomum micranthum f. kanehirae TaxID=337451 RepID=A0A443NHN6_9MAGN|nr:hypothetical protein CKAN_00653100 [Cinnamomum micranthum f. kanehirae]
MATIDISSNQLSGSIPYSIGNCKSLRELYMANNFLSGLIPFFLSAKQFSGTIPANLDKLMALQFLNLSFNNLIGEV